MFSPKQAFYRFSAYLIAMLLVTVPLSAQPLSDEGISLTVKEASLEEVFKTIEEKTDFSFSFSDNVINDLNKYSFSMEKANIQDVLDKITKDSNYKFRRINKTIYVISKEGGKPNSIEPTKKPVKGKITDENGNPLPGATIRLKKEPTSGIITDINGEFHIDVSEDAVLVVRYIGFLTQEIPVEDRSILDVQMKEDPMQLDEVVVTAVGITRNERALGYSISKVRSDDFENSGVNMLSSLQGKVTGVNISTLSNDPGSSVLMNIRGATSLNIRHSSANSQPLFVIDGIPITTNLNFINRVDMGNAISDLNPSDIESITVLKGASAAALYGSDAGNGVIMITTKTGAKKKKGVSVEYSVSSTANTAFKTLDLQKEFSGGDRDIYVYNAVTQGWGPSLANGGFTGRRWNMKTQEWETDALLTSADEDRIKAFLETGFTTTHNVTITSNNEDGGFRLSYNNLRDKGVVPNTAIYKNSVNFTGIKNVRRNLTVSVKGTYLRSFSPNRPITTGSSNEGNVINSLYNMANQIQPISDMEEYWLDEGEGIYPNPIMFDGDEADYINPYWQVNEHINSVTKDWTFGRIQADWNIVDALSLMFRSGVDLNSYNYEGRKAWGYSEDPYGNFRLKSNSNFTSNTDVILNFDKYFNDFSTNINVGYNYQYTSITNSNMGASSLSRPNDFNISNAASGADTKSSSWSKGLKQSVFGTAQIGYKRMGYIELTGRKDWGGILEEDKNSYFYPSASISLIPTSMFKMPVWMDFAKVRMGVAQVGHGMGQPRNTDSYSFASTDWGDAKLVGIGGSLVDDDLKPETTNSIEFGADLNLFENRIGFDFTAFQKSHINQLLNVSIPQSSGFGSMTTNVGDVISKGYEWSLSLVPVKTENVIWSLSTNFSKAEAKIDRLAESFGDYQIIGVEGYLYYKLAEGEKIGNMYQKYQPVLVEEGKYKGMYIIRWENGEGFERTTDGDKKKCIGNYNPDFIMGFNTNLKYKNWNLNIVANLRYGGEYVSRTMADLASNGFLPETLKGGTKYSTGWVGGRNGEYGGFEWLDPGSGTNSVVNGRLSDLGRDIDDAVYLVGVYVNPESGLDYSDPNAGDENYIVNGADPNSTLWSTSADAAYDWIYKFAENRSLDATNFKIKEVTLTYNFNQQFVQKLKLNNLSLSLVARNIWHWYASGFNEDPETAFSISDGYFNQGTSRYTLPPIASWGFRLNVGI